jgi:hypothetical protein
VGSETLRDLTDFMPMALNRKGKRPELSSIELYIHRLLDIVQLIFVDRTQCLFSFHYPSLCSSQSKADEIHPLSMP